MWNGPFDILGASFDVSSGPLYKRSDPLGVLNGPFVLWSETVFLLIDPFALTNGSFDVQNGPLNKRNGSFHVPNASFDASNATLDMPNGPFEASNAPPETPPVTCKALCTQKIAGFGSHKAEISTPIAPEDKETGTRGPPMTVPALDSDADAALGAFSGTSA